MSKIYCSNCGNLIAENSNFCRFCGAAQHGPEAALYRAEEPPLRSSLGAYVLAQAKKPAKSAGKGSKHEYIPRRHLSARVVWSFLISYIGATSIVLILFLIVAWLDPLLFAIAFSTYLVTMYIVAVIVYNHFYFSVDEDGFYKEHGIIHKRTVTIPYQQIQNVNITRSFIDRLLGLSRLSIETAGSSAVGQRDFGGGSKSQAEGHLPGLTLDDAKTVHDLLLEKAGNHNN